jgi:hypothetical protein
MTVEALCDALEAWPAAVKQALGEMAAAGVPVREAADGWRLDLAPAPTGAEFRTDTEPDRIRLGLVSDTHLCSKVDQLDALAAAYDTFAREGVRDVLHMGDMVDGFGVYRGQEFEIRCAGMDEQVEYAAEFYPRRDGIRTRFVKERLSETSWQRRDYIADLRGIERTIESNGPHGGAGNLAWGSIIMSYPVEVECVGKEIREGLYTPPEEFQRLLAAYEQRTIGEDRAAEDSRHQADAAAKQAWIDAGGRP